MKNEQLLKVLKQFAERMDIQSERIDLIVDRLDLMDKLRELK